MHSESWLPRLGTRLGAFLAIVAFSSAIVGPPVRGFGFGIKSAEAQPADNEAANPFRVMTGCCAYGCGGHCCRCGYSSGHWGNCLGARCKVGLNEFEAAPLSFANPIHVTGRLVKNGSPLASEPVSLTLPGGSMITGNTGSDGRFELDVKGATSSQPLSISMGDLQSVPSSEREEGEGNTYQLFLVPKTMKTTSSTSH